MIFKFPGNSRDFPGILLKNSRFPGNLQPREIGRSTCALITRILVVEFMTSKFQKIISRNCVNETFLFLDMLCKIVQGIRKKCF